MEDDVATSSPIASAKMGIENATIIKSNGEEVPVTGKTIYLKGDEEFLVLVKISDSDCQNLGTARLSILERQDSTEYEIKWSNGADYPKITGLLPGNHSVTIAADKGNALIVNFEIKGYGPLFVDVLPIGVNPFSAQAIMEDGTPTVEYLWSDGQTASKANFTSSGNYSVTATDSWGCTAIQTFSLPFEIPLGIVEITADDFFNISPNPSKDFFKIDFLSSQASKATITVYNLMGQVVYQLEDYESFLGATEIVDAAAWERGLYLVKIKVGEASFSEKIIRY